MPGPRPLWWLPALAGALLLSPVLAFGSLILLGDAYYLALWGGAALAGVATWGLARWRRAPAAGAWGLAILAGAAALLVTAAMLSGVR